MSKQIHIRLEDTLYKALSVYTETSGQSVQDCISGAVMQMLNKQNSSTVNPDAPFTFIDLFAGIGGMRLAFEEAGGHCVCLSSLEKQQVFVRPGFIERIVYIPFPGHAVKGLGIPG